MAHHVGMPILYAQQAKQVARLLSSADERQTLRRYLRRQEAVLMSPDRRGALDLLVATCRDGYLPYEASIGRARMRLGLA